MTDPGSSFLAALGSQAPTVPAGIPPSAGAATAADTAPAAPTADAVIYSDVTPSGILVEYSPAPRRFYRVNGVEVPSVTTVLDVLNKPQLPWWGMKTGVAGMLELFARKRIGTMVDWGGTSQEKIVDLGDADQDIDVARLVDLLTEEKLTVNHVRDKAGDRGVNVHDALETWAKVGQMPNPDDFPDTERGYVQGLVRFLEDLAPAPMACEVMVGSERHRFAGRYDLKLGLVDREYTSRCYPKRADKRERIGDTITVLCDLKTSKVVVASHHLQLAAYELASVEGGEFPTNKQAVIHVTADGKYEFVFSKGTGEDFLVIRAAYEALRGLGV